ncbi:MAG: phenylalanine--tRNA ligase subunit beta [Burkholderiaceae bacterium]
MKFPESWLRAYVDPAWSTEQLSDALTMAGLEVEQADPYAPPFEQVVVARVRAVERHPDADKLNVCEVDTGGDVRTIVCGAPNVRAGARVPCALPGAVLPGGLTIAVAKVRGVQSSGMLCSARELGLSDDHAGLLLLPDDAPVGADLREYLSLDDTVFTLKLTPNRPDCLAVYGIAREVSALSGAPLAPMPAPASPVPVTIDDRLPVQVLAPDLCGRFSGRVIRGVDAKAPTPAWIRERLERAGQRSISALVDLSNYVMLELGRPTHVFDLNKIHGGLQVRWARPGESLELLNGQTAELDERVGVIADEQSVESLAGIMGGQATAVSLETTDVFVEAAFWWPTAIAGRSRRFNFSTDAGHRFERGVDASTTAEHLDYLTALILQVCGGRAGPLDDVVLELPFRPPVAMRGDRARRVIGAPIGDADIAQAFDRLGLAFEQQADRFIVTPPPYRFDLQIEEDLIEEVARMWGYDRLPLAPPKAAITMREAPLGTQTPMALRRRVAARDYMEIIGYSFVDSTIDALLSDRPAIRLLNPIASQMDVMRTTLFGGLIETLRHNLNRKAGRVRLFEMGRVFVADPAVASGPQSVNGVEQPWMLGLLAYGPALDEQWGAPTREVDFFDVKGDLEALVDLPGLRFVAEASPGLHPGRSATILLQDRPIGRIGALHPALQQRFDLPHPVILAEVARDPLLARPVPAFEPISKFPPAIRDLAWVVPEKLTVEKMLEQIRAAIAENPAASVVTNVKLFDEYRGKGLENKEKSLAFRFWMQDTQRTLSDVEVSEALASVIDRVQRMLGARLRS